MRDRPLMVQSVIRFKNPLLQQKGLFLQPVDNVLFRPVCFIQLSATGILNAIQLHLLHEAGPDQTCDPCGRQGQQPLTETRHCIGDVGDVYGASAASPGIHPPFLLLCSPGAEGKKNRRTGKDRKVRALKRAGT